MSFFLGVTVLQCTTHIINIYIYMYKYGLSYIHMDPRMILPFTGMRKCTYGPPCGYSLDRMGNGTSERPETQQLDSPHVKTSWLVVKKPSWKCLWLRQWLSDDIPHIYVYIYVYEMKHKIPWFETTNQLPIKKKGGREIGRWRRGANMGGVK